MAPSSTSKSKRSVASSCSKSSNRKKPPPSLSSSSSKVVKGRRTVAKVSMNKKTKDASAAVKITKIPTLPSDWPVSSQQPTYNPADASALCPGSLLQHKCSGRDIHLPRSAVTAPNIDKEKGKFLLILPGMMSFHKKKPPPSTTTSSAAGSTKGDDVEDDNDNDKNDDSDVILLDDDNDDDEDDGEEGGGGGGTKSQKNPSSKKQQASTSTTTTTTTLPSSLGKLDGLRTDHPTLSIPFPQLRKKLIFPGKKVPTSSKYIMLSCSNKQKGSVQCKVCFGECHTRQILCIFCECVSVCSLYHTTNF